MKGIPLLYLIAVLAPAVPAISADLMEIVQQSRHVENLSPAADQLISRLEKEVAKIIQAGHLMPFRVQYGEGKPRNLYAEPWMMMFTLARAHPHVSKDAQSAITAYLRRETKLHPPWSRTALGPTGAYRQGDPGGVPEQGLPPRCRPTGTMFYALWLYGHCSGDWSVIQAQWKNLQAIYADVAANPPTYESISGAIAMSRLARAVGDGPKERLYATEAVKLMQEGKDFERFRRNAHLAYSRRPDWYRGSDGIAFALFYLTPEVARYISEQPDLRRAVDGYADRSAAVWPLWWMAQAPIGDGGYFDEGCCAGPETRMMLFHYCAWVRKKSAEQLTALVDVPDALVGDCFYLQNLVTAIEGWGRIEWR